MRFKDFLKLDEEQSGTDQGLMGYGVSSKETRGRAPSDGQPFMDTLKGTAGARQARASSGGMDPMSAGGMFMKKKMKKMKKA